MKRRILFLLATFFASAALLVLQKPLFLLFYAHQAAAASPMEWWQVVAHGLTLDLTVAGYITALPLLLTILSLWVRLSDRVWRALFTSYFVLIAIVVAVVVAVDLGLYGYWGFRIDGSILIYLADPKSAMASVGVWEGIRQVVVFVVIAVAMGWVYRHIARLFSGAKVRLRLPATGLLLLLGGVLFIAIRGGVSVATANISKVYFSSNMFLNHAATNPLFSLLSTLGVEEDYAATYPFFDEQTRAQHFDTLRGNRAGNLSDSVQLLRTQRPNVVVVILESVGRTVMDAKVAGSAVMPNLQRLKHEGIWFENFFANSFRTDRGEVAILNGFPAQTRMSIMKLPAKSRTLPSVARSLASEGYATSFTYGGDLNFTNQASYMYSTGWQTLVWQRDMHFDAPTSKWGYADDVVTDYFADQVEGLSQTRRPFLAGMLTLSSHEPFDVPLKRFDDKLLNAMAFTDECVGRMIDRWRASAAWDNLLVVLVADHACAYPEGVQYNEVLRHRIPMIWLGGALKEPRTVESYGSQIDLAATLLGQMGVAHADFDYSKDLFDARLPKFGYYTFVEGFGVVDRHGAAIYDCTQRAVLEQSNPALLDVGRTMLQTTYVDIDKR
ncbi:MAG: LTA synthase family protein [Alistipes sp.]